MRLAAKAGLGLGCVVLPVVALGVGSGAVGVGEALASLFQLATGAEPEPPPLVRAIVWELRVPRILLAMLLGAALGVAGTLTQGLFRNPLAEPGVLGVSLGAAAAAVLGFWLGLDALGSWTIPLCGAGGAAAILAVLWALAGRAPGLGSLLLSGIAIGALCSAMITVLVAWSGDRWDLGLKVSQWLMGSFEGRSWPQLGWALGPCALGFAISAWLRLDLDVLHLGSETAASLGVDLPRTRGLAITSVALLVGTATALTGVIGFVGLMVPHLARAGVGPGHRRLVPLAALVGAVLLLAVDTLTRASSMFVIPPGVVTSLLGAPFFLWLLRRYAPGGAP